jgi:hypothetical protein
MVIVVQLVADAEGEAFGGSGERDMHAHAVRQRLADDAVGNRRVGADDEVDRRGAVGGNLRQRGARDVVPRRFQVVVGLDLQIEGAGADLGIGHRPQNKRAIAHVIDDLAGDEDAVGGGGILIQTRGVDEANAGGNRGEDWSTHGKCVCSLELSARGSARSLP